MCTNILIFKNNLLQFQGFIISLFVCVFKLLKISLATIVLDYVLNLKLLERRKDVTEHYHKHLGKEKFHFNRLYYIFEVYSSLINEEVRLKEPY